jgi:2'-5' RNA ligase
MRNPLLQPKDRARLARSKVPAKAAAKRVVKEEKPPFTWGSAPDAFFHGTTEEIAAKILKGGLTPNVEDRANLSAKGYVYLSRSASGAAQWGKAQARKRGGKPALIRIVLPPELLKKVEQDDWEIGVDLKNDCRFKGTIPAAYCSLYPMQGEQDGHMWNYASKTAKLPAANTQAIVAALNAVKGQVIAQNLGNLEIAEIFNRALAPWRVTFSDEMGQESGHPGHARAYLTHAATDVQGNIVIGYEREFYEQFDDMSDQEWNDFVNVVVSLIAHELTHRGQINSIREKHQNEYDAQNAMRSMEADPSSQWKYYSNPHEIAAFARTVVQELRAVNYDDKQILELIRNNTKMKDSAGDSDQLWIYFDLFGQDDPVFKQLLQQIFKVVTHKESSEKVAGPQGDARAQHTDHSENEITMTDPKHPFAEDKPPATKEAKGGPGKKKNAYVIIELPSSAAAKVVEAGHTIPDEELGGDGREEDSHITVKFGVREEADTLATTLEGVTPFSVRLGKLHVFVPSESSGSQAPVVAEAIAPQLKELHDKIAETMGARPDDFPYKSHVTLAYVNPKFAQKYEGSDLVEGITFQVNEVTLSKRDGTRDRVKLTQAKAVTASALMLWHGGTEEFAALRPVQYLADSREAALSWAKIRAKQRNADTIYLYQFLVSPDMVVDKGEDADVPGVHFYRSKEELKPAHVERLQSKTAAPAIPAKFKKRFNWKPAGALPEIPMNAAVWLLADGSTISAPNYSHSEMADVILGNYDAPGVDPADFSSSEEVNCTIFGQRYHAVRIASQASYMLWNMPTDAQWRALAKFAKGADAIYFSFWGAPEAREGCRTIGDMRRKVEHLTKTADFNRVQGEDVIRKFRAVGVETELIGSVSKKPSGRDLDLLVKTPMSSEELIQKAEQLGLQHVGNTTIGPEEAADVNALDSTRPFHPGWSEVQHFKSPWGSINLWEIDEVSLPKTGSDKTPPFSNTQYDNMDDASGEGTNAYALVPERVKGKNEETPLEVLNPALFKEAATVPLNMTVDRWIYHPNYGAYSADASNSV